MALTFSSVTKDRKMQRRIDHGAAVNSVQSSLAALVIYLLLATVGGLYQDLEGLTVIVGMLVILTAAFRMYLMMRFETLYGAGPGRWRSLFASGLLLHGLVWGLILAAIVHIYAIGVAFLIAAIYVLGVTTALSTAWMAGLKTRQIYIVMMLLPASLVLLFRGDAESLVLAGLILVYGAYLFRMFAEQQGIFLHSIARDRRAPPVQTGNVISLDRRKDIQLSLVYRLAHELRTPMNSMLGMLSLMEHTKLDGEQREYLQVANQSGKLLLSSIDDVLDYSRILTGRIALNPEFFDLRHAVEQTLDAYGPIAQSNRLELTCVIDRHVPRRIRGDRERFLQVINNLVSNAIKFSDSGEVRIEVDYGFVSRDAAAPAAASGQLTVRVVDQGTGIEPELATQLFEDEFQSPNKDPFVFRHRGFGLLVCKGLVEAMGGQIGVQSEPGKGSAFWFDARLEAQHDMLDRTHLRRVISRRRALIAGGAQGTADAMAEELEALDATCLTADDYDHALQALREGHRERCEVNLLFVDTWLRRDQAINLCRTVADDPALAGVTLVLMVTIDELGRSSVQGLAQRYSIPVLTKPLHQSGLRSVLKAIYGIEEEVEKDDLLSRRGEDISRRRDYRLLLVEDNEVNQIVTRGMLDKLGYQVKTVNNGGAAVELVGREHFDLILMDCMMPEMDGFESTRRIREKEAEQSRVPVIAMTANTVEGAQARCLAAGMDDFLAKPVHLDQLDTMLRHWLPPVPRLLGGDESTHDHSGHHQ